MAEKAINKRAVTEVGRRVLERLRQLEWNQARLARECGRTDQWVTELLRRRYLAAPTIRMLVKTLDMSAGYLMPEEEE